MMKKLCIVLLCVWAAVLTVPAGATNLLHHWTLDETAGTIAADSVGGLDGTIVNNVGLGHPGRLGNAMLFPGQNNSGINTNSTTTLPATGPFSLFAFIKTTAHSTGQGHVFSNHSAGIAGRSNFGIDLGRLFWFHNGGLGFQPVGPTINDGKWYLVGMTRDADNNWKLWINETAYDIGNSTAALGTSLNWHIGTNGGRNQFALNGFIDDVRIYNQAVTASYIFQTRAWGPIPADNATGVTTYPMLQWNTAMDTANPEQVNPDVTAHYLYVTIDEPNFLDISPISIAATGATGMYQTDLTQDHEVYWRVDQAINGSAYDDPNTIEGFVWSFETLKTVPVITSAPSDILLDAAGDKAVFSVGVDSFSPVMFQLYRSSDMTPSFDEVTGLPLDAPIGDAVGPLFPPDVTGVLEIDHVQFEDEGFYYVQVWNDAGQEEAVYTDVVRLGIKRLMAHWTLDADKFVGGQHLDETGSYPSDPNDPAIATTSFVDGVIGDAIVVNAGSFANAGTWRPNAVTGQMTVSAWVKVTGTVSGDSQGIISKRDADGLDWSLYVRGGDGSHPGGNYVRFSSHAGGDVWAGPNAFTANEWVYVTAVVDGGNAGRVYINGRQAGVDSAWNWGPNPDAPIMLGAGSPTLLTLPGQLDDVKIYNYALDAEAIAQTYVNVTGEPMCFYGNPALDVSGPDGQPDCVVDLYDFAELAAQWLESGLMHPQP